MPDEQPTTNNEQPAAEAAAPGPLSTPEYVRSLEQDRQQLAARVAELEAVSNATGNALAQEGTSTYVCTKAEVGPAGHAAELKLYDASKDGPFAEEITIQCLSRRPAFTEGVKYAIVAQKLGVLLLAAALVFSLQPSVVRAQSAPSRPCAACAVTATAQRPAPRCYCKPVRRAAKRTGNATRNALRCLFGAPPVPFTPPACGCARP